MKVTINEKNGTSHIVTLLPFESVVTSPPFLQNFLVHLQVLAGNIDKENLPNLTRNEGLRLDSQTGSYVLTENGRQNLKLVQAITWLNENVMAINVDDLPADELQKILLIQRLRERTDLITNLVAFLSEVSVPDKGTHVKEAMHVHLVKAFTETHVEAVNLVPILSKAKPGGPSEREARRAILKAKSQQAATALPAVSAQRRQAEEQEAQKRAQRRQVEEREAREKAQLEQAEREAQESARQLEQAEREAQERARQLEQAEREAQERARQLEQAEREAQEKAQREQAELEQEKTRRRQAEEIALRRQAEERARRREVDEREEVQETARQLEQAKQEAQRQSGIEQAKDLDARPNESQDAVKRLEQTIDVGTSPKGHTAGEIVLAIVMGLTIVYPIIIGLVSFGRWLFSSPELIQPTELIGGVTRPSNDSDTSSKSSVSETESARLNLKSPPTTTPGYLAVYDKTYHAPWSACLNPASEPKVPKASF